MGQFKYEKELGTFSDCPGKCRELDKSVLFRLVHGEAEDRRNHLPNALLPPRVNNPNYKLSCGDYALSFFDSESELRKLRTQIHNSNPNYLVLSIGYLVAQFETSSGDGRFTPRNAKGHIMLHEFATCNLSSRLKVIGDALS